MYRFGEAVLWCSRLESAKLLVLIAVLLLLSVFHCVTAVVLYAVREFWCLGWQDWLLFPPAVSGFEGLGCNFDMPLTMAVLVRCGGSAALHYRGPCDTNSVGRVYNFMGRGSASSKGLQCVVAVLGCFTDGVLMLGAEESQVKIVNGLEAMFMYRGWSLLIRSHEEMSLKLVDYMVDEHNIEVDSDSIRKVKEMIIASSNVAVAKRTKEKHFLYDIVANGCNGIDVDKFDYIGRDCRACGLGCNFQYRRLLEGMRVMGDEICYPAKEYLTIHKLFSTRAELHRTVYTHAKVKAIELMLVDALVKANDVLEISSAVSDPAEYWKLDDSILKAIEISSDRELQESRELVRRIRRRELYQFCNEYSVPKEKVEHFKDITPQDIVCSQNANRPTIKVEDVAVSNVKIDLTRGKENPLESINFFKDYDSDKKFTISDHCVSHLLPSSYQDRIVRVYAKKPELVEAISEAFENLQLKMYGVTTQVHETPEKKKRKRCLGL